MSYKFAKTFLVGSVLAMGAFGLVACGDDKASSPNNGGQGQDISVDSRQDASIIFAGLNVVSAGTQMKLTGSISLAFTDTTIAASENLQFTGVTIQIGKVNGASVQTIAAAPTFTLPTTFPTNKSISLTEANVMFNLQDPSLTECGDYQFIITATANDGTSKKDFSNTQVANFKRPDMYCATAPAPQSSSSQPTAGVEMVACPVITLSTELNPGLDVATCSAVAATTADIVIVKSKAGANDDWSVTSGNGTMFSPITNSDEYGNDYWPNDAKGSTFMSDFKYKSITGTTISNMQENYVDEIYVAKGPSFNEATGAGFFAFSIVPKSATIGNNGSYTVKLQVYKTK